MRAISASATVSHPPERVFEFLSDLRNHWTLEERFIDLEDVEPGGGRVRMKGPLGLGRVARTRVLEATTPQPVAHLRGSAEISGGTRGHVEWTIEPAGNGSRVTLSAIPDALGLLDAVLLRMGGGRWLERLFRSAVARLDDVLVEERPPARTPEAAKPS
jgi:uncharacterized protein YndB with AHSA1/START domain